MPRARRAQAIASFDPVEIARPIRSTDVGFKQERLRLEIGARDAPDDALEAQRATALAGTAEGLVLDGRLREPGGVAQHGATAARWEARLADNEAHGAVRDAVVETAAASRAADRLPHSSRTKKFLLLSFTAKLIFLVGDTTLLAGIFYRIGVDLRIALLAAMSTGMTAIMAGAMAGRHVASDGQRRQRGRAPDLTDPSHRFLYDDGKATDAVSAWVAIAAAVLLGLVVGIFLLGVGAGDNEAMALGSALIAGLTVLGSAAAEGLGTNLAADLRADAERRARRARQAFREVEHARAELAEHDAMTMVLREAAEHAASSTSAMVAVVADRRVDAPRVYGDRPSQERACQLNPKPCVRPPTDCSDVVRTPFDGDG